MAMEKPLFDIDRPGMQAQVNSYKPGNGLAWKQLFPLKYTSRFDLKGLEGDEGIPVAADRVAFNAKAPIKSRKTVGSWSGKLGKFAVSREKDEMEVNEYQDLQTLAAANENPAEARNLVDIVYNDLDFCNNAMDYKVEIDAMRIGSESKQVYNEETDGENVTEDQIDFKVPSENKVGCKVPWATYNASKKEYTPNTETANGLDDIIKLARKIKRGGGKAPKYCIMEKLAFEWLQGQKATAKLLFPRYEESLITADMITLDSINRFMRNGGHPQILVLDTYATIQEKDGTEKLIKPWVEHSVVLSPEPRLGYTYYKPVPMVQNTDALQVQGEYYKMTRYSEVNPMKEVTMAEAYIQPGLSNRKSLGYINVAKTTWNEGKAE